VVPTLVIAALEAALPFSLISYGEQFVSSSLTGLLIASVPLFVMLLALGIDASERPTPRRVAGIALGLLGVAVVLGLDLGGGSPLLGAALVLGAACSYGLAGLLIKRWFTGRHPLLAPTTTVTIAAIAMAPLAAVAGGRPHPTAIADLALLGLGFLCTAAAFVAYFALITEAGAGRAAIVTYLNPLIAVALGAAILHERLTISTLLGAALILGGSALANLGGSPAATGQTRAVVPDAVRSG
jgi:drug/metabolite transporter (DMT)-like permease